MNKEFTCNSRPLAEYLKKNGSKFIRIDKGLFVFEYDDSIEDNLKRYEAIQKRCMF